MAVVDGLNAEEIAARLGMDLTDETVEYYTGALYMVGLHHDGRGLVVTDTAAEVTPLEDERLLARLSSGAKVVVFEINEAIDLYRVTYWANGMMAWRVTHCHQEADTEALEVLGQPPRVLGDIEGQYRAVQAEAEARGEILDPYGSIVVDLFNSITGIEFDMPGWWADLEYRALEP
jgi:hypothetical protein